LGGTCPASPNIEEGWPGVRPKDWCFPCLSDDVPLHPDGWPDLSLPVSDGVQVTIKVKSTVEDVEGTPPVGRLWL
jgi:hypothetical protein